jgi:putative component of toxin-antitoxin plasmid stabilization module
VTTPGIPEPHKASHPSTNGTSIAAIVNGVSFTINLGTSARILSATRTRLRIDTGPSHRVKFLRHAYLLLLLLIPSHSHTQSTTLSGAGCRHCVKTRSSKISYSPGNKDVEIIFG